MLRWLLTLVCMLQTSIESLRNEVGKFTSTGTATSEISIGFLTQIYSNAYVWLVTAPTASCRINSGHVYQCAFKRRTCVRACNRLHQNVSLLFSQVVISPTSRQKTLSQALRLNKHEWTRDTTQRGLCRDPALISLSYHFETSYTFQLIYSYDSHRPIFFI